MLRMEKQKHKSLSVLNLLILMKRSKNTKGKAEDISFLVTKGWGAVAVWCSVLALKSARGIIQASFWADPVPCPASVLLQLRFWLCLQCVALLMWCQSDTFTQNILYQGFLVVHPLIEVPWATQILKEATVQLVFHTSLCVQTHHC